MNITGANAYAGTLLMQNGSAINFASATDSLFVHNNLSGVSFGGNGVLVLKNFDGKTVNINTGFTVPFLNAQGLSSFNANVDVSNLFNLTNNARVSINNSNILLTGSTSTNYKRC